MLSLIFCLIFTSYSVFITDTITHSSADSSTNLTAYYSANSNFPTFYLITFSISSSIPNSICSFTHHPICNFISHIICLISNRSNDSSAKSSAGFISHFNFSSILPSGMLISNSNLKSELHITRSESELCPP